MSIEIYDDIDRLPHEQFRLAYGVTNFCSGEKVAVLVAFTHRSAIDMYAQTYVGAAYKEIPRFGAYPKPPKEYV